MIVRAQEAMPRYLAICLLSIPILKHQIDLCRMRAAQPHLNAEELGNTIFPVPPRNEQKAISAFLDCELSKIDRLIKTTRRHIALLQERRAALISAAVTGKIDVRDAP